MRPSLAESFLPSSRFRLGTAGGCTRYAHATRGVGVSGRSCRAGNDAADACAGRIRSARKSIRLTSAACAGAIQSLMWRAGKPDMAGRRARAARSGPGHVCATSPEGTRRRRLRGSAEVSLTASDRWIGRSLESGVRARRARPGRPRYKLAQSKKYSNVLQAQVSPPEMIQVSIPSWPN